MRRRRSHSVSASLRRWPDFGAELGRLVDVELFTSDDSLTVALDAADAADLHTVADWGPSRATSCAS